MAVMTFLPRCAPSACERPTVVVVLPSPSGVGVMAVTSMYLPFGDAGFLSNLADGEGRGGLGNVKVAGHRAFEVGQFVGHSKILLVESLKIKIQFEGAVTFREEVYQIFAMSVACGSSEMKRFRRFRCLSASFT
jgi:hypothetical protein